jgi:hypothetical protein
VDKSFQEHEKKSLSNKIPETLKTDLDIAVAGTDNRQNEVLTAIIDTGLDNEEPPAELADEVEDALEEWEDE